jgi:hypothetical protein
VSGADGIAAGEVGDGAGDFEDAVEGAGGEAEALEGGVEEGAAGRLDGTEPAESLGSHGGVDRAAGRGPEALALEGTGGGDALGHEGGGLSRAAAELAQGDRGDLDVEVDAVEERAGDAGAVALDQRGWTATIEAWVS